MASKGPRSKLDHETRARRQKALEAPKEPPRPKAHWDHVLEEMVWLSKDFEAERKWKLAQAKKVAIRASKSIGDHGTMGEKKVKEEEQRLRKVALNISKDVKKFWIKIEKLVLYKHQLELEERKKKALDKQLDFLLGQTERYSTMLAENLVNRPSAVKPLLIDPKVDRATNSKEVIEGGLIEANKDSGSQLDDMEVDDEYGVRSEDESEDDENTIEQDEALITEAERKEELAALQAEADLPLEELLKNYSHGQASRESCRENGEDAAAAVSTLHKDQSEDSQHHVNGSKHSKLSPKHSLASCGENHSSSISREHRSSLNNSFQVSLEDNDGDDRSSLSGCTLRSRKSKLHSNGFIPKEESSLFDSGDQQDDKDYILAAEEDKDDERTLLEEEELAKEDTVQPDDEINLLRQESEMPIEELLARYKKDVCSDDGIAESESEPESASSDQEDSVIHEDANYEDLIPSLDTNACKEDLPAKQIELDSQVEEIDTNDMVVDKRDSENIIADAAAAARSAQPTGNTFSTTKVLTKFPFLLKYPLREYQHIGLDWLVTMYEKRLNGILADEMGLGKTIMTIALLAHLACEKGIWGPHLIVVPTSVMLNWETEFLKWCPAFKILTYFGSAKERKNKRQGWLKPNSFHICITTYRLVIQDSKVFKRKKWKYLILDEAHLIKNWKSQRWQTLLNFNSKRRILLTGTPLQNDLMELWSLMHFLMPHIFQSHQEFKGWFSNPISGMVEGQEKVNREVLDRLHNVLRPFILRRLKRDVEKQLPKKYEHIIYCRLSKRQRNLYEDFIASSETQATLASSNFFGMISVIMQLRKVCNHPDLFEGRPIVSSFDMARIDMQLSSAVCTILSCDPFTRADLLNLNLVFTHLDSNMTSWEFDEVALNACSSNSIEEKMLVVSDRGPLFSGTDQRRSSGTNIFEEIQREICEERVRQFKERVSSIAWWNSIRCQKKPVYGTNLRKLVTVRHPVSDIYHQKNSPSCYMEFSSSLANVILSPVERLQRMLDLVESFMFAIPASRTPPPVCWCSKGGSPVLVQSAHAEKCTEVFSPLLTPIRPVIVRRQVYFPDRRLIQFDCGKLQELSVLLRRLKSDGHRALIFTQMTKMLDVLEAFINLYGYTYMRLDGSTPPEERQTLMQRFNTNPKFFLFILSTRSGGVGINLVGADTVIFYDSDWNPAMDQQAQDRCHRIGQTREVHIYRLIIESTIEENILKKANQKRLLDDLVIQSGSYNTEFFKKLDPMELFSGQGALPVDNMHEKSSIAVESSNDRMKVLSNADVEAAIKQAEDEADYMALKRVEQEEAVENQEFTEEVPAKLDDDEYVNDDDMKPDERITEEQNCLKSTVKNENDADEENALTKVVEEKAITLVEGDEDIDMLADVKQMAAAAAAAGQASSSFENQLRPIDRYAMRFLDLWDPIIDKSAVEHQANVEEEEWELERIEKLKEDLEAEIDEDQEPFLYERWDADFATKAYREHVEALAQRQLEEEQELEGQDNDATRNEATIERMPKSKKKPKKKKKKPVKSLKKESSISDLDIYDDDSPVDSMSMDEKVHSPDIIYMDSPPHSSSKRKRKKVMMEPEDEQDSRKSLKKQKKAPDRKVTGDSNPAFKQLVEVRDSKSGGVDNLDCKPSNRSKSKGKISITVMPIKRVMVVRPERLKKKRNLWSKDCFPPSDSWSPQEDAMLCAIVHEYDTNWALVSDMLYSIPGGGFYRGWFRHPVHCCERFRELYIKYVHSTTDSSNAEKITMSGSGKALFKVTEDHINKLLNIVCDIPDNELHLQKHFTALISSAWRAKWRSSRNTSSRVSASHGMISGRLTEGMSLMTIRQSSKLVLTALSDVSVNYPQETSSVPCQVVSRPLEQLDLTLDFPMSNGDLDPAFPSSISVSIPLQEPPKQAVEHPGQSLLAESSCRLAENRLRLASEACISGECSEWASSAFSSCDVKSRSSGKSQSLGKHKAVSDSSRPHRTKMLKTAVPNDGSAKFFITSPRPPMDFNGIPLYMDNVSDPYPLLQATNECLVELPDEEYVPVEYDPEFYAGIDDLGLMSDISDFG